jgi:hypothetical protein
MATRPARPRPAQPQAAKTQAAKTQAAKTQAAKTQAAKTQAVKTQAAESGGAQPKRPAKPSQPAGSAQPAKPGQPAVPAAPPRELRLAAAVQAVEAAGLLVAAGLAAVATADGKSYERSSGIALTLISVGTAALFAALAAGLAKARPWTRTPVVMFQLAIGIWGVFLVAGHRYEWGVPMLLLAAATLACLFTPASLRALNRPPRQP